MLENYYEIKSKEIENKIEDMFTELGFFNKLAIADSDNHTINQLVSESKETVSPEIKNKLSVVDDLISVKLFDNGESYARCYIMPDIKDVRVIADGKVVFVDFKDGTTEKAILSSEDTYSLEQGISVCITKKLLSLITNDNGSSVYNKIIDRAVKIMKNNRKVEEEAAKKAEEDKARAKKIADKKRAKRIAAEQKKLNNAIDLYKYIIDKVVSELASSENTTESELSEVNQ